MLANGLGDALSLAVGDHNRVFDLFTGSGAVAWHIAQKYEREVIASDLQSYAIALAAAVIERTEPLATQHWIEDWFDRAKSAGSHGYYKLASDLQRSLRGGDILKLATSAKELCSEAKSPISLAYGGYYFSPLQALWLDNLRNSLPTVRCQREVALAALIVAASQAAAAPGHTAQPFKPNNTAGRFLKEAWKRDIPYLVKRAATDLSARHAKRPGKAMIGDANELAKQVKEGDLVFLDPPYSGVHYSRFYHVLETVAVGRVGEISGIGRYPPPHERPRSDYSLKTKSKSVFDKLLWQLSERGASAIVTFPAGAASNGMSGEDVASMCEQHFSIRETRVSSRFSTLGGDKKHREARQITEELILVLSPQ